MRPGPLHRGRVHADDRHAELVAEREDLVARRAASSARICDRKVPRCGVCSRADDARRPRRSWRPTTCGRRRATFGGRRRSHHGGRALDVGVQHGRRVAQAHRVDAGDVEHGVARPGCPSSSGGRIVEIARGPARAPSATDDLGGGLAARQRPDEPALGAPGDGRSAPPTNPDPPVTKTSPTRRQRSRALRSRRARRPRATAVPREVLDRRRHGDHRGDRHRDLVEVPVTDHDVGPPDRQEDREELHVRLQLAPDRGRHHRAVPGGHHAAEPHDQAARGR